MREALLDKLYGVKIPLATNLVTRSADALILAMKFIDYKDCEAHHS